MEEKKIVALINKAIKDDTFFESLISNPISTLGKEEYKLDFNSEDLNELKKMFSEDDFISNKQLMNLVLRLAKGTLPPPPPPPPPMIALLKFLIKWDVG